MLTGTYIQTVGEKGRIIVPSSFRRVIGPHLIATRAPGRCILLLQPRQWRSCIRQNLRRCGFQELYLSGARPLRIAAAGRINVTLDLREWAGLRPGDEVACVGLGGVLLMCRRDRWNAKLQAQEEQLIASLLTSEIQLCKS